MKATLRTVARVALAGSVCWLATGLAPLPLGADVVHLSNGRSMEGVILEETSDLVLLKLPFGEIGLPWASIDRVERGRSALEEYLERRAILEQGGHGRASDWLELALWAEQEGIDHSAREATLVAARLEPGLPGLVRTMTALGYEYEEKLAIWIPHDEFMRRRGYILNNGRWLSPNEAVEWRRAQEAAIANELERQRQDRLARAMEMMVLAQLAQAEETRRLREETAIVSHGIALWGGYPVVVAPGYRPRLPLRPEPHRGGHDNRSRHAESSSSQDHRDAIVTRPPGSLIPIAPAKSHRGGFQQPPGGSD